MTKIHLYSSGMLLLGIICMILQINTRTNYAGYCCCIAFLTSLYLYILEKRRKDTTRTKLADYCFIASFLGGILALVYIGTLDVRQKINITYQIPVVPVVILIISVYTPILFLVLEYRKRKKMLH